MPSGALMDRHVIAQSIEELAQRPALGTRKEELTALAAALRNQDAAELDPWSELDLLATYARPESLRTPGGGEHPVWSYAEGALGALVFVPLMLTWYGLTRASSAYGALTGADPRAASRPFLQLWQSGFEGHLTGAFTFGHVAMSATVAIALLFSLVLVHGLRRSAVTRREEGDGRGREELMAALVPALTRAQLVLNGQRSSSPQRFAAELTESAATLRRLGDKAVRVHKELTAAASAVGEAVHGAERALSGVDTSVKPLEIAVGRVEAAVSDGGARVRQALDDVREASGEVRLAVHGAGDRVEESVTVLAASQRAYATGIEVTSDVSAQLLGRFGEVAEDTARAVAESQHAVRELSAQSGALRAVADEFARLVAELRAGGPAHSGPPVQTDGAYGTDWASGTGRTAQAGQADGPADQAGSQASQAGGRAGRANQATRTGQAGVWSGGAQAAHGHGRSPDAGHTSAADAGHAPSADGGQAPSDRFGAPVEQADPPAGRFGPPSDDPGHPGSARPDPRRGPPPLPPVPPLTEAR
ncbi:methyl-accepting chemotaxis protein [Streptomyces sp. NPDC051920]|uniref:methyl-accepting chemotaxis protein n=1 Tax=Streptomyces sp. NPDC051920 TaxID=3155523 RepID=UPI00342BACE8